MDPQVFQSLAFVAVFGGFAAAEWVRGELRPRMAGREDDRLDIVAYRAWREPERFWRICDANRAFWPDALVAEPGRVLLLPAAED